MLVKHILRLLFLGLIASVPLTAYSALTIQINRGEKGATPIAIVPFKFQTKAPAGFEDVAAIIANDLARSGRFAPIDPANMPSRPGDVSEVDFADWRLMRTAHIVIGKVKQIPGGKYSIEFRLMDVNRGTQVTGFQVNTGLKELRRTAHQFSDIIYQRLTGERGAFDTQIAYITESGTKKQRRYSLQVADSDGFGARTILSSRSPIMSPNWAPDGRRLSYVSFEAKKPQVFIQDLASGKRRKLTSFPGLNGSPAFSPDGRKLALTLSKDGNPEIYVMDIAGSRLRRLTTNGAIDTEATWSPDGQWIAFTSNRGGKPQIYRIPAAGGRAERITFEGNYNARPRYSPDGKHLAFVYGNDQIFRIGIMELSTGNLNVLTDTYLDESPSFAPNGSMILYATSNNRGSALAAISVDGDIQQTLVERGGLAREPAWSPYRGK